MASFTVALKQWVIDTVSDLQDDIDAKATAAQGALAETAVQPGDLALSVVFVTSLENIPGGTPADTLIVVRTA